MHKHELLLFGSGFFIGGIALRSFFSLNFFLFYLLALASLVAFFALRHPNLRLLAFGGIFLFLGVWRYGMMAPLESDATLISHYNGKEGVVFGRVCEYPDERIKNIKLTLCAQNFVLGRETHDVNGKVLATVSLAHQYEYGDNLAISGELQAPEPFNGFAYDRYLARYDIYSLVFYPSVEFKNSSEKNDLWRFLYGLKHALEEKIERFVPEPQASVLNAILFNKRGGIPDELEEDFIQSGIMHLIAISGSHITLMIIMVSSLSAYLFLPRKTAFILISIFIFAYVLLIGAPASAVRAAVMGWIGLYAKHKGRFSETGPLLLFAGGIMLLQNPYLLRDDIGFQLSFLSVWGMSEFIPMWQEKFSFLPRIFKMNEILLMTFAAYLATLGLVILYFGNVALISPISNIFLIPIFIPIFVSSAIVLPFSFLFPAIGSYLLFVPYVCISYIIGGAKFFSNIPFSSVQFSSVPLEAVGIFYLSIFIFLYYQKKSSIYA